MLFLKKRCSFTYTKEKKKTNTLLQIHHCIDLLFHKKLDRQLPTVTYATIMCTTRAFHVFWLNHGKRIAMMVQTFESVLGVNKPIDMGQYTAQLLFI